MATTNQQLIGSRKRSTKDRQMMEKSTSTNIGDTVSSLGEDLLKTSVTITKNNTKDPRDSEENGSNQYVKDGRDIKDPARKKLVLPQPYLFSQQQQKQQHNQSQSQTVLLQTSRNMVSPLISHSEYLPATYFQDCDFDPDMESQPQPQNRDPYGFYQQAIDSHLKDNMPRFRYLDSSNMREMSYLDTGMEMDRRDEAEGISSEAEHVHFQHQYRNLSPIDIKQFKDSHSCDSHHEFALQTSVESEEGYTRSLPNNKETDFGGHDLDRAMVFSGENNTDDAFSSFSRPIVVGYEPRYPHELRRQLRPLSAQSFTGSSVGIMDDEEDNEQSDNSLFVLNNQERERNRAPLIPRYRVDKTRSNMTVPTRPFTHDNLIREEPETFRQPSKKPQAPKMRGRGNPPTGSKSQDNKLLPSRSSGARMPWPIQEAPELVPTDTVSDAYLQKRNLPRPAGAKIVKRASGANDPENLAIVNKYDYEQKSWEIIAKELNNERIELGRVPTLTSNSVILRYNRTAPIYYESIGEDFIPLKLRKKGGLPGEPFQLKDRLLVKWEQKHDDTLVRVVKQYDEAKWNTVATLMNKEFPGEIFTAKGVAVRFRTQ